MTWALFVAGAPTQVVSQWSVDDQSTARLMARFYRGVKQGKGKGAALREAGLWLMGSRGRHYAHPYYWAPFVLMGDWH
jgi:CHAT domain-containing protein